MTGKATENKVIVAKTHRENLLFAVSATKDLQLADHHLLTVTVLAGISQAIALKTDNLRIILWNETRAVN